ncbi:MAG: hypothetical protein WDZ85_00545 [Candidatus Paceibacterota bacterium]
MNIRESYQRFWSDYRIIILPVLILSLTFATGFGLGYLTATEENRIPIIIEKYSSDLPTYR